MARAGLSAERAEFTKKLESQTVNETETVTIECQLSKPHQTVQWRQKNKPVVQDGRITVNVDTHKHQLIIRHVTPEDAGNVSCHYGNADTEFHLQSHTCYCHNVRTHCTLTVQEAAPYFKKKLENQTNTETDTTLLTCLMSKPTQKVVWMKDEVPVIQDDHISVINDEYTHQLTIRDLKLEDAGIFRCVCGNVSTECNLTVEELKPEFSKKLENQTKKETETVTLRCQLSKPNKDVKWMKYNQSIIPDDHMAVIADEYTHQLTIRDLKLEDPGIFRCVYGNASTECKLTVIELEPEFSKKLENQTDKETETATLTCRLSKPNKDVKWMKDNTSVIPDDHMAVIADEYTHQLIIRDSKLEDAGIFRCVCGNASTECNLTVEELEPEFSKKLENQTEKETETITLTCQLSKPNKDVKWMKHNQSIIPDDHMAVIVDKYTHQLTIRDLKLDDAGIFRCVCGNASTECKLTVIELQLEFTNTLENKTVYKTATVIFECRLSKPNKTVQWVHNGQHIRLDDRISVTVAICTHRLIIKGVKMEDVGTVQCVCGNVSADCTLTVKELPEQNDWFDGENHINWVKTCMSLCFMKKGITSFSNEKAIDLHMDIKKDVSQRIPAIATCTQCTYKEVKKTKSQAKKTTTWRMDCNICSVWLKEILSRHIHENKIEWKNSDPRLWSSDGWEIVKLFQPFGCQDQHKAEDCDATGLLTLIIDCHFFSRFKFNLQLLQEIKDVRNVCMHSKDLIITDGDMKQSLDKMVTFLGETELQKYQSAHEAAKQIKQLRDGRLDLSFKTILDETVLKDKLTEVQYNIKRLDDTNNNLRGGTGSKSAQRDTYIGDYIKRLKQFQDMFSEVENSLENIIREKDNDINKTFTQFIYVMNRLQDIEQDNREVDEYYQPKTSTLESEQQDIPSESQEQTEQPEERQLTVAAPAPYFSKELRNQTVYENAKVTLECELSQSNQTVRWLKGVTQVCSSDHITVEADTYIHRLTIRDVTLEDAGTFWCFCDNVSSSCTLEVNELAPEFIIKLENHTVIEAGTVNLSCQLSKPNKTVQWLRDGSPVLPDERTIVTADEYIHRLIITDVTLGDCGNFRCICDKESTQCTLTVNEAVPFLIKKLESQTKTETDTVMLMCLLSKPNQKVMWMRDEVPIIPDDDITVTAEEYTHQLTIRDLKMEDAGIFRCVYGNASTECKLTVKGRFVKPLEDIQGYTNCYTTLSCEISRPNQTVTWTKDGQAVSGSYDHNIVSGIYTHQLIFPKLTNSEAGKYTCSYRDVTTTATLTLLDDDDQASRELGLQRESAKDVRKAVLERSATLQKLTLLTVDLSSLGDQLSDVLTLQHLVHLTLGGYECDTKLSHEQCQNLGRDLHGSPQLRELSLRRISCTSHREKSGCVQLDLGWQLRLHGITLHTLPFTRVVFNPELLLRCHICLEDNVACQVSTLQNLLAARNLQQFRCYYVDDADAASKLVDVLSQLRGLQKLTLCDIDFGSVTDIRLSATMEQLESVELYQCEFDPAGLECLLQQHNLPQRRVQITLRYVTIRGEEDVISKIRQSPDTEVTEDEDVKYSEGEWEVEWFVFYTRK